MHEDKGIPNMRQKKSIKGLAINPRIMPKTSTALLTKDGVRICLLYCRRSPGRPVETSQKIKTRICEMTIIKVLGPEETGPRLVSEPWCSNLSCWFSTCIYPPSLLTVYNKMEGLLTPKEQAEGRVEGEEEDHVFLDLDDVYEYTDIPANVPYVLSGLNTLNPVLIIDNKLKLIGEYEETIGTCYVFSEGKSETVLVHQETGPSEANLFEDISIVDPDQAASRQVKPVASLHKVIKFRLASDDEIKATS